jgi:hypothetical protein
VITFSNLQCDVTPAPNGWRYRRLGEATDETGKAARLDSLFSAAHQTSGAPSNDGKRSFSTRERFVTYKEIGQKMTFFEEKGAFFTLSG